MKRLRLTKIRYIRFLNSTSDLTLQNDMEQMILNSHRKKYITKKEAEYRLSKTWQHNNIRFPWLRFHAKVYGWSFNESELKDK